MHALGRIGVVALCALSFAVLAGAEGFAADEPANIIKYRQNVMKAIGANIANIAMVAKGEVTYTGNVPFNARSIHDGLGLIEPLFPEGTGTGDTKALPKIWEDNAGFHQARKEAIEAAATMVEASQSGDVGQIREAITALGKKCGNCHDNFRKEE